MIQRIGVIGLGQVGSIIAELLSKCFEVVGYDLDVSRMKELNMKGIKTVSSLEEMDKIDCLLLSLPFPSASINTMSIMIRKMRANSIVIETSTVAPYDMKNLKEICSPHSINVIDAAIIGGISKLKKGKTTFLVGATKENYDRAIPVLETLAEDILHNGDVGTGMAAKVVNNAVAHSVMVVLIEAAALASSLGVSMESMVELLQRESGLMRPLTHRFKERILNQNYSAGMSTHNAKKDSVLALEIGKDHGIPLYAIQATHTVYEVATREGLGDQDYSSIAQLWEKWLDTSFTTKDITIPKDTME
jgi:3-hydroxyisobutyrate dehydrogenase-like beta-hydroxyacid dehydrogenase